VNEFLNQLRAFYEGLDPTRRRVLITVMVLAAAFIIGVGVWAAQPQYVTLSRFATTDDMVSVSSSLGRMGIPYRLGADGLSIEVPATNELDARKAMSSEGIVVGLEGIEKLEPWATPFKEQMYRQMMMQNELIRSINGIDGIAASKVHLNLPNRSEFLRDQVRATASVTLRPDGGSTLSQDTARSVARLVANSVNGMTTADVTVLDVSDGRTLWGGEAEDPTGSADLNKLTARREIELSEAVRTVLGRMLGSPDALTVTVSAELDTATVQSTVQAIDPNTSTPAEEKITSSQSGALNTQAVGVPGTDSNLPERTGATAGTSGGSKSETQATTYDYTRTTTTTTKPAGAIKRLSASVMINTEVLQAMLVAAAPDGKVDPAAEAALRADLEEAVRAALGYDPVRGDQVVVKFSRFADVQLSEAEVQPTMAVLERQSTNILLAIVLILAFVMVVRPLMRYLLSTPPSPVSAAQPAAAGALGAANAPMPASAESTEELNRRLRLAVENFESLSAQDLSELVSRESEHSAAVLRRWIRG
jgi:flagellar M-ring protein FliF